MLAGVNFSSSPTTDQVPATLGCSAGVAPVAEGAPLNSTSIPAVPLTTVAGGSFRTRVRVVPVTPLVPLVPLAPLALLVPVVPLVPLAPLAPLTPLVPLAPVGRTPWAE